MKPNRGIDKLLRMLQKWVDKWGRILSMSNRKELREEKKEVYAMDLLAIEAAGIREELRCVCHQLKRLNDFLRAAKSIQITQQGEEMGTINGVPVGGTGIFGGTAQPAGTSFGSVLPVWTSSDTTNTTLTAAPSLNPDGTYSVSVAVAASAPVGGSFTLTGTWTATDGSGDVATGTATVPYLAAVTPPPTNPTSIDIAQTA